MPPQSFRKNTHTLSDCRSNEVENYSVREKWCEKLDRRSVLFFSRRHKKTCIGGQEIKVALYLFF